MVAERAGVSAMTVSRVINRSGLVAESTRLKVEKAIAVLGYEPPPVERRFRSAMRRRQRIKTGNIALLFPDPSAEAMRTALSAELAHGMESVLHDNNLNLIVTHLRGPDALPNCIANRQVDGVIVRGGRLTPELQRVLKPFPCVSVLGGIDGDFADSVQPDDDRIGVLAATQLLSRGHRRVVCLNVDDRHGAHLVRSDAFVRTVRLAGAECDSMACAHDDGRALVDRFSLRASGIDAVFIPGFTDHAPAPAVTDRLIDLGFDKRRGRDAAIELYVAQDLRPRVAERLICIDPRNEEVARRAVRQLLHRIRHPEEERCRVLVAPRVVGERGTMSDER
jgi:LacI family transcriptional regulator